ncbi:MAG: YfiH family protein [Pseudohongiellaceae bacterium]
MGGAGDFLAAPWLAPGNVLAGTTLRTKGLSRKPFATNNMGLHVGDNATYVANNRLQLASSIGKDQNWQWLEQTHSVDVVRVEEAGPALEADAIYTSVPNIMCCVMSADCLPVFITNQEGSEVAIAHCGWRGLAGGVLDNTLAEFKSQPDQLLVYLGPAIGPCHFEVGEDVKAAFSVSMPKATVDTLFAPKGHDKYLADIYGLAKAKLHELGVSNHFGGEACTVCDSERFFSFRRDGVTGRMANFICLTS